MRRSVLMTLALLGAVVSLIGGVGLFAALTDTGRTGTITADSDALAGSADVKLTTADVIDIGLDGVLDIACDSTGYSDDLATGSNTASVTPGFRSETLYFCIKNVGSQPVSLTFDAFEMVDVELDCTGDESIFDPNCGILTTGSPGVGELSGVLSVEVDWYPMCDPNLNQLSSSVLGSLTSTPLALHGLSSGGAADCYSLTLVYGNGAPNTPAMIQAAQSDRVTWRFRFNAAA